MIDEQLVAVVESHLQSAVLVLEAVGGAADLDGNRRQPAAEPYCPGRSNRPPREGAAQ
jgi:hypothetical protein